MSDLPVVNTHVHVPPNFSAFGTPTEVIEAAVAQGVRALGISNFYDQQVYARFDAEAREAGIVPLFGLEFITLDPALEADGVRVNDPANPGRIYFCGKGISPFKDKSDAAEATATEIRSGNDARAEAMVSQLTEHFTQHGVPTELDAATVAAAVAERGDVPPEWVSLQERHVARAYQEVIADLPEAEQADAVARVYGAPAKAHPGDAVATQGEIRSRLIKAGTPGFVPEVPLSFEDAYAYVLAMDGIPTYPILADGAPELSPFEWPPATLASHLVERGVYAAELIPARNRSEVVTAYVEELTAHGIIVMGGTEHNTLDRISLDPACADGPLPDAARAAFFEATCVVAAHQHLVAQGEPGYVDATGGIATGTAADAAARRAELAELGAQLIGR
ncbi:hypothetical protein [Propioniciclava soli]|uniref:PHP domain-containing protein n=1 Tax=Propioniciclava soli TaxID=2775081 RepID=A0ABZ3C877_9ACTN|nr:hypothetical protein [Propioniciclava soli]